MIEFRWTDIILLLTTVILILYVYWLREINKVAQKGLKFINPKPFFGNNFKVAFNLSHLNDEVAAVYNKFPEERYAAFFNFGKPNIMIRDPKLILDITLKHFDHFVDHYTFLDEELDPLFYYGLFQLRGERWRDMRSSLTPAFTGSKMKEMVPFIKVCSNSLLKHLNDLIDKSNGMCDIETKGLMLKCANDVIASCAFGLVTDSLEDPENQFFDKAKKLTQIKPKDFIRVVPIIVFPKISKFLGIHLMKDELAYYYRNIIKRIMTSREETGVIRRDMIHLLTLAKKGKLQNDVNATDDDECNDLANFYENLIEKKGMKRNWKDDEIVAQTLIFIFAGLEPTTTLMSFVLYELTLNEDCQKKLRDEIDEFVKSNGEDINYGQINKLKYMDMVVTETLRLWPPVGTLDRLCTKEFEIPPTNDTNGLKIECNDVIMIPVFCLHRDPKYWEDPLKFDPERFSDENKHKITPNTFMPFGNGPRLCIGNRFVLMECKMLVFYILSNFELIRTSKTEVPLKIMSHFFALNAKNGTWIGIKRRNDKI